MEALHIKDKEELETGLFLSIVLSEAYNDSTGERCTATTCNDLLGPERTTEPVTSGFGVSVLLRLCHQHRSWRPRALRREPSPI